MLRDLVAAVRRLHEQLRAAVILAGERQTTDDLSRVASDGAGDTLYALDSVTEAPLVDFFQREVASHVPILLIAEGIAGGRLVLPADAPEADVRWQVIVDPIDGTRPLMYQKRSGWILTGIAPNRGSATGLHDIEAAVQTEIPLRKQHLADVLWAFRGEGAHAERWNRLTGERAPLVLKPSRAATLAHGFAMVARFFPGEREVLAAIDDEIVTAVVGPPQPGKGTGQQHARPVTVTSDLIGPTIKHPALLDYRSVWFVATPGRLPPCFDKPISSFVLRRLPA